MAQASVSHHIDNGYLFTARLMAGRPAPVYRIVLCSPLFYPKLAHHTGKSLNNKKNRRSQGTIHAVLQKVIAFASVESARGDMKGASVVYKKCNTTDALSGKGLT